MSDMKCPFCGKHIRYLGTDLFTCDACHIMLPAKHWIAYINTRKALDRAKWWLHEIVENHRCTPISTAEMALKDITVLEQKDK